MNCKSNPETNISNPSYVTKPDFATTPKLGSKNICVDNMHTSMMQYKFKF